MDICGDNRFEIIERAKKHLLDATNIDTSADEMKVLDDFLYRCWQMGWLDRYDTADTPQTEVGYCNECRWFGDKQVCGRCRSRNLFAKADTPQEEGSEQMNNAEKAITGKVVEKAEINGYGIRLTMNDGTVFDYDATDAGMSMWDIWNTADTPQTDCGWK